MTFDPFTVGWLVGFISGGAAGVMGLLTYQWWTDRRRWRKHDELDGYLARLRSLDRGPKPKKPRPLIPERPSTQGFRTERFRKIR